MSIPNIKVEIYRNDELEFTADNIEHAAEYLGLEVSMILKLLHDGGSYHHISLEECENESRMGNIVLAYTERKITKFNSFRACSLAYHMSRSKLERLIDQGATADDGRTTFDIPYTKEKKEIK